MQSTQKNMFLEAGASKCVNGIGTGGKLSLNDSGLIFSSQDQEVTALDWTKIKQVNCYKSLGVIPNGFTLELINGESHHFIVDSRLIWHEAIQSKLEACMSLKFHPDLG